MINDYDFKMTANKMEYAIAARVAPELPQACRTVEATRA